MEFWKSITVNGYDLRDFSAKLQTAYRTGACSVTTDTFQGKSRSSVLLLDQTFAAMEIVLPLEFWGRSRQDTVEKWSLFCRVLCGEVELNLGDGFLYACAVKDFGTPVWLHEGWLTVDVTLLGLRQRPEVRITAETDFGSAVSCTSTFPRTDCVITLPEAVLKGAEQVSVRLGENSWYLTMPFTENGDLVLDGVHKVFLYCGENVAAQMSWKDFPYLVPGRNPIGVYINTIGITRGVEIRYRPTFL